MGQAQQGPYENNRGLIFPTMAQASELSKFLIIWQSEQTCLFWICLHLWTKIHCPWPFPWKWLVLIRMRKFISRLPCYTLMKNINWRIFDLILNSQSWNYKKWLVNSVENWYVDLGRERVSATKWTAFIPKSNKSFLINQLLFLPPPPHPKKKKLVLIKIDTLMAPSQALRSSWMLHEKFRNLTKIQLFQF